MENFIGLYHQAMSGDECDKIIQYFESHPELHHKGKVIERGVESCRTDVKDSTDIVMHIAEECDTNESVILALRLGIHQYKTKFPILDKGCNWDVVHKYNIQRYYPGQGFHLAHCEYEPSNTNLLAWMIYLNDVNDGGETRFEYYDLNIKPQKGTLVIWPAYFTHTHCGLPSSETKYIATGWHHFI